MFEKIRSALPLIIVVGLLLAIVSVNASSAPTVPLSAPTSCLPLLGTYVQIDHDGDPSTPTHDYVDGYTIPGFNGEITVRYPTPSGQFAMVTYHLPPGGWFVTSKEGGYYGALWTAEGWIEL